MDLSKNSLPARERKIFFQLLTLTHTLSSLVFVLAYHDWEPEISLMVTTKRGPSQIKYLFFVNLLALELKKIPVFILLIPWSEASS